MDKKKSDAKKPIRKKTAKEKPAKSNNNKNGNGHPLFSQNLTLGQRASEFISEFGGSWTFIIIFMAFLLFWMFINTWIFYNRGFDPYPFILLNLVLSCLAAIQAPIILMAQNRQTIRDRIDASYDHQINRKAEREIQRVQKDLHNIRKMIHDMHSKK